MSEGDLPKIGKRYRCEHCGTEVIVLRAGPLMVTCHGEPMVPVDSAALPASD
jgi:desulfoferrodoxin-like iron-binding protein